MRLSIAYASAVMALMATQNVHAATTTVQVSDPNGGLGFTPSNINIKPGDTVSFVFHGPHTASHASASNGCAPANPQEFNFNGNSGQVFNHTFNTAGTFNLYCAIPGHCAGGMKGVILVGSGSGSSAAPATTTTSGSNSNSGGGSTSDASSLSVKASLVAAGAALLGFIM
ncbi:hypothetical protein BZG36_05770 [Bifiguratus adelaidae]|uniref:Blue (type 1) copper domain-containing protein n=1 Tax=Bifiguratus adelaidae TaxID=1938954 RepID=A0A261XVI1_9FUNG|nr:hypothetical protein BZG36_05770 [Bifiguratus adelaidae]